MSVSPATFLERCREAHELVQGFLSDTLPWGSVPARHKDYQYDQNRREGVKNKIKKSLKVLQTAVKRHGLSEIAISYNGGKDCLVMLILVLACIYTTDPDHIPHHYKLNSIYINSEMPFPDLARFITDSAAHYHLEHRTLQAPLKEGFEQYLHEINVECKTIIVGIRYTDPYGSELEYEQMTDHNWPSFLRIHPILHWNYVDIWDFLVGCNVEYCHMYDLGYTSLGGIDNTVPNPYLKRDDKYLPAYMLYDQADERERLGRQKARK